METTLQFKSTRNVRPVVLEDDAGKQTEYELRELTVAEREKYMNSLSKRTKVNEEGKPCGFIKFDDLYADLLTRCMHKKTEAGFTAVTKEEVAIWPASAASQIFEAAQHLNHIEKEKVAEDEAAKNE